MERASCPFCTISRGCPPGAQNTASTRINEDDNHSPFIVASTEGAVAFLDQLPLTKCHTLVIPREHYEMLSDIPAVVAAEVGRMLPIVCRAVMEVSGADAFNVVQNNGLPCMGLGLMLRYQCGTGGSTRPFSYHSTVSRTY
jgi:diadenosine tetraphosphate (Ap4A) HIT family hydrolase